MTTARGMNKHNLISTKSAIITGAIIATVLVYLGFPFTIAILIALTAATILASTKITDSGNRQESEKNEMVSSLNLNRVFKPTAYIALLLIGLHYLIPMLDESSASKKTGNPLDDIFYIESQTGSGQATNNLNGGIRFESGNSGKGSFFILKTKTPKTIWPSFGTLMLASKEGSTLQVSFLSRDNPSLSIYFSKIAIPTKPGFSYGSFYKINNAIAVQFENKLQTQIDNINTIYRKEPIRNNIKLEIYVAPNSYVDLNKIVTYRI